MVQCRLAIQRDGFTPPDVQALLPGAEAGTAPGGGRAASRWCWAGCWASPRRRPSGSWTSCCPPTWPGRGEEAITWVAWDAYSHSLREWDGLGLTWAQLDQAVREDLEDYFEEETNGCNQSFHHPGALSVGADRLPGVGGLLQDNQKLEQRRAGTSLTRPCT